MCDRCVAGRWFISYHITISTNCIGPKDCMKYVLNKAAAGETLCRVFHFVAFPTLMHCKWSVYLVSINSWLTDAWCPVSLSLHSVHYSGGFQLCNPSLAGSEYLSSSLSTSLQEAVRHTQPGPCLSKPQSWIQSLQQNITTKDELECQSFWIVVWQDQGAGKSGGITSNSTVVFISWWSISKIKQFLFPANLEEVISLCKEKCDTNWVKIILKVHVKIELAENRPELLK